MKPRIKLITLPWDLEVPTLTLASLAAVTPPQFDVCLVDLLRERLVFDEPVDLVGITASTPRINAAYALADLYRAKGVKVVIGGHHATAMPAEARCHADAVVVGEGESSWRRICEEFLGNPARVDGIYNEPAPDLASLPQPRMDLLKLERYGPFSYPLIASRGCPESCSFCFAKRMTHGFRTYPIAHVVEQVRRRPKSVRAAYFVDDNLPADFGYARELFKALEPLGLTFAMQARHEFAFAPERLEEARRAGCRLISSGYESVNQSSLDRVGKRAKAVDYREIARNVFAAGILPSGNWMFGFDWDGPDVFQNTLEFLDSSDLMHCSFTSEIPFPGTATFKRYDREGRILTHDYGEYVGKDRVIVRPKGMTPGQLRDGIRWLARSYYSLGRATRRARRGFANERLRDLGPYALRVGGMLALNYYQVWQWHARMTPSLTWLYERIQSVYKYRYFRDLFRGTNFWSSDPERVSSEQGATAPSSSDSPFLHAEGHKPTRFAPLLPVSRQDGGLVEK